MFKPEGLEQTRRLPPMPARAPVRIMVLDKQRLFHACVEALIGPEQDLEYIGGSESCHGIIPCIRELQPDVILLDFELVAGGVAEVVSRIARAAPRARIVMLAAIPDFGIIQSAVDAGAAGCVLKTAGSGELMTAVRTVTAGRQFLRTGALQACGAASRRRSRGMTAGTAVITNRELEVLRCIVAGNSSKLTARKLGISPKTVSKHRASLMRKLNLSHVSDLARFAHRYGLAG